MQAGRGGAAGAGSGVDLDSKRLAKRLEGLYEKLTGIGFREAQVRVLCVVVV